MRVKKLLALSFGLLFVPAAMAQVAAPPAATAVAPAADPANILDLDLSTGGRVRILLRPDKAPNSVARIKTLARRGFYDNITFHRVIDGFMAQTGDPRGDGSGGSDLPDLAAEFNDLPHLRGTVAMARAQAENSANSQFYIMFLPRMSLDKRYTVIGRVIEGMQYVDMIERGEPPANRSRIVKAQIEGDNGHPPIEAPVPVPPPAAVEPAPAAAPAPTAETPTAPPASAPDGPEAPAETGDPQ